MKVQGITEATPGRAALSYYVDLRLGVISDHPVRHEDAERLTAQRFGIEAATYASKATSYRKHDEDGDRERSHDRRPERHDRRPRR